MDWAATGQEERLLSWLEAAATERYIKDRRLDPFATSMRDFDDVTPNLQALRDGKAPGVNDPRQRITDLKGAVLVSENGEKLSELGLAALAGWEQYAVASSKKEDELARHVILILEALRLKVPMYVEFASYWKDLREHFDPLELIDNWDALYALNYLDFERAAIRPGELVRKAAIPAKDAEFDLPQFAIAVGASENAKTGANRIEDAIGGKVPRGRHRATFCMALEIVASAGGNTNYMLAQFGFPKKPRLWKQFSDEQIQTIHTLLADYGLAKEEGETVPETAILTLEEPTDDEEPAEAPKAKKPAEKIPLVIGEVDFAAVLVATPVSKKSGKAGGQKGGAKKKDYVKLAAKNDETGKLGEEFAMAYERWRLRELPELLAKLNQVSKEDDSLGYDIESFETDGKPRFVEVKGTLGPLSTKFFLTETELEASKKHGKQYVILRVSLQAKKPQCCEIRAPLEDELELTPAVYSVGFKAEE